MVNSKSQNQNHRVLEDENGKPPLGPEMQPRVSVILPAKEQVMTVH